MLVSNSTYVNILSTINAYLGIKTNLCNLSNKNLSKWGESFQNWNGRFCMQKVEKISWIDDIKLTLKEL